MDDIRELSDRLMELERRYRRLQALLVFILLIAGGIMLMGQTRPPLDRPLPPTSASRPANAPREAVVRAESFILTDDKGQERASLVTDGGGSVFLVLFDKNGKPRADLQVNNYGPSLNFYDPNAKPRVAIGSTTLVASHVNKDGVVERNTPSSIVMFDAGGQLVWRTP
jgi:hypothetical protein